MVRPPGKLCEDYADENSVFPFYSDGGQPVSLTFEPCRHWGDSKWQKSAQDGVNNACESGGGREVASGAVSLHAPVPKVLHSLPHKRCTMYIPSKVRICFLSGFTSPFSQRYRQSEPFWLRRKRTAPKPSVKFAIPPPEPVWTVPEHSRDSSASREASVLPSPTHPTEQYSPAPERQNDTRTAISTQSYTTAAPKLEDEKPEDSSVLGVPHFHHDFAGMSLGGSESGPATASPASWDSAQRVELPEELISIILKQYWNIVHVFWPIFYKQEIRDPYSSAIYNDVPAMAVNAMIIAAAGTLECTRAHQETLDALLWTTERDVLITAVERPSIAVCQTLILLGLKSHRCCQTNKTWQFIGLACRTIVGLGFHRDRPHEPDLQTKRRVYWVAFIADKLVGIELGRPWALRRADSDAKLTSEKDLEEVEVGNLLYPVDNQPGPGRVLSTFNAGCRMAVIFEKVMDCRTTFATPVQREAAVTAIDAICLRWAAILPASLRQTEGNILPMNMGAAYTLHYSCMALLHISAATDAILSRKSPAEDVSLKRIVDISTDWSSMVAMVGQRYSFSVQCALPITFPTLLLCTTNNLIGSHESLEANRHLLAGLMTHRERARNLDSYASISHIINSISSLVPSVPSTVYSQHAQSPIHSPGYSEPDSWMIQDNLEPSFAYPPDEMGIPGYGSASPTDWVVGAGDKSREEGPGRYGGFGVPGSFGSFVQA
ncbi:hypothetical protein P7C70_g6474, partial [Phenoliferia sp. Uapishka_3]